MKKNNAISLDENSDDISNKKENTVIVFIKEWIVPIIAALGIWFLLNKFVFINVILPPSGSMIPTLNNNDRLIASRVWNKDDIRRGDIIIFKSDELNELLIKRVIGLPGDHIEIIDGVVSVNGEKINEDYVKNNKEYTGVFDVPESKLFFLGDNRKESYDSRYWDNPYIDKSCIEGKAQFRYYPINDMKIIK
ncbi:signal peptidase I [Clostridium sp. SM-530-WT-3G]|uniref:signal peptidase I n=1 Tax=Clostridium sp. SM-530-WT-3G TaxID=2725303 RepID=UPI00145F178B|nr:signal peptidase I [Clostridium sp. SM-530-WT-3G]NME84145.1 signal peptidase I [Clostridium sp. SM-530-WT-3G]